MAGYPGDWVTFRVTWAIDRIPCVCLPCPRLNQPGAVCPPFGLAMQRGSDTSRLMPLVTQGIFGMPTESEFYTIGQLHRELGVSLRTFRFYEMKGIIKPSDRKGNRRLYSAEDRQNIINVLKYARMGFRLMEIGAGPITRERLEKKLSELYEERDAVDDCIKLVTDELGSDS